MQYTLFYYKIGVRVVESGDKWFKVVIFRLNESKLFPLTVADHLCVESCTEDAVRANECSGRVIDDVHGRIQSHNRHKGQADHSFKIQRSVGRYLRGDERIGWLPVCV